MTCTEMLRTSLTCADNCIRLSYCYLLYVGLYSDLTVYFWPQHVLFHPITMLNYFLFFVAEVRCVLYVGLFPILSTWRPTKHAVCKMDNECCILITTNRNCSIFKTLRQNENSDLWTSIWIISFSSKTTKYLRSERNVK